MKIRQATIPDAWNIAKVNVDTWRTTYKGIVSDDFLNELSFISDKEFGKYTNIMALK